MPDARVAAQRGVRSSSSSDAAEAPDRPLPAIGFLLLAMLTFVAMDGMAKYLAQSMAPQQIVFARFAIVSLLLVDARIVTLPVLMYNSIRAIITPDLAALSVVYIAIAVVSILILDRLVGEE